MRTAKRLQRQRSQYRKGQPRHWFSPGCLSIPKYSPSRVRNAKRLLKSLLDGVSDIKTDYYVFFG